MITRETQAAFLERPKEERRKKHFFQTWTTQCLSLRLLQEQNRGADTERTSRGRGIFTHFERFVTVPSRSVCQGGCSGNSLERRARRVFIQTCFI